MKTVKVRIDVMSSDFSDVYMVLNILVPEEETLYETLVKIENAIKKEKFLIKTYGKKFNPSKRKHCRR